MNTKILSNQMAKTYISRAYEPFRVSKYHNVMRLNKNLLIVTTTFTKCLNFLLSYFQYKEPLHLMFFHQLQHDEAHFRHQQESLKKGKYKKYSRMQTKITKFCLGHHFQVRFIKKYLKETFKTFMCRKSTKKSKRSFLGYEFYDQTLINKI